MALFLSESRKDPVFLDTTKRRKWYFRTSTVVCFFGLLLAFALFIFGLSFATANRDVVPYADAIERYHYYYSAANIKKIAFTFDDGPHSPSTEDIAEILKKEEVPATFFFIGRKALVRPDIVKEISDQGFDVQDHSFTHAPEVHSSYERFAFEVNSTSYIISQITGKPVDLYRPPFLLGIGIDPTVNPYIPATEDLVWSLKLGYLPVGSDIDSKDWLANSKEGVVEGFKFGLESSPNGHVVLFHDDKNTVEALPEIIEYLKTEGYSIVPLRELITPPSGEALALSTTLKFGDTNGKTNGDVSKLQWFLYKNNYLDPYALSGVFDEETRNAVIAFQTENGIVDPSNPNTAVLGIVGPQTRELIARIAIDTKPAEPKAPINPIFVIQDAFRPVFEAVTAGYVSLYPAVSGFLSVAILVMLILVMARTIGLVLLFFYRWLKNEKELDPVVDGEGVSILIPAYNEQENIAATLESVIRTTYKTREIIVINDGSKDNTAGEVEAVIAAHPGDNIRLITIENGGKAKALNIGLKEAFYNLIVVLDADAVLNPEAVSYFVPHFADPQVGAVAGRVHTTQSSNLLDIFQTLEYAIGQNIDKTAFSTINAIGVVPGPAGAWRKSFILEAGGFHTDTLVEDQEMTLALLYRDKKVVYEPRAIAYTETPHTIKNFLKQRFRWVYGTMQCFWKHKGIVIERPLGNMTLVVMPNIFIFNIMLPLTYPFADSALIFGLIFGEWNSLVLPFLVFTAIDMLYALWGLRGEQGKWKLLLMVPLQRIVYRQLLYYTVYKSFVRAIEGRGTGWNKFTKSGETRRFYLTTLGGVGAALGVGKPAVAAAQTSGTPAQESLSQLTEEEVTVVFQGPDGTSPASANLQEAMSLSVLPTESPSPYGPTSTH